MGAMSYLSHGYSVYLPSETGQLKENPRSWISCDCHQFSGLGNASLGVSASPFLTALTAQMQTVNLLNRLQMLSTYFLTLPEVVGDADSIIFIPATNNNEFSLFQESDCNCSRHAGRCAFHRQPS